MSDLYRRHLFRLMGLDATTPRTMSTQGAYLHSLSNHAAAEGTLADISPKDQ